MNDSKNNLDLETATIEALSVASKTPFRTAFKVTLGIGLARLALFIGFVATLVSAYKLLK